MERLAKKYIGEYQKMTRINKKAEVDLEKYISDIKNGEYENVLANDDRFEIFLQLSRMRHSLFQWYEFREHSSVLEINGEYGALTELLCEKAGSVTTVVRTKEKARIIEKRCERFENLEIIVEGPDGLEDERKYDYLIIVGALEYFCQGYKGIRPYVERLTKILNFLAEDGTVFLATENRYGLKYFCGEGDPVTGEPFAGLNRYPGGSDGYLFSRQELTEILSGVPGLKYKFYYPLPDFHFPQMIYTDRCLPGTNIKERLLSPVKDMSTLVMNENRLYDDIAANGVFPFFSNSFLVECNFNGKFDSTEYAALTTDRGKKHGFATIVKSDCVIKKALYSEGSPAVEALSENIDALNIMGIDTVPHKRSGLEILMPRVKLPTLSEVLKKAIRTDPKQFKDWFEILYEEIMKSSESGIFSQSKFRHYSMDPEIWGPILKKAYIDMIPINCFAEEEKGKLSFFDQEFVWSHIPAGYIMFRALKYTYFFMPFAKEIVPLSTMKEKYKLETVWRYYEEEERKFVADNRDYKTYGAFHRWCKRDGKQIYANIEKLQK